MILQEINQAYKIYDSLIKQLEEGILDFRYLYKSVFRKFIKRRKYKKPSYFCKTISSTFKVKSRQLFISNIYNLKRTISKDIDYDKFSKEINDIRQLL